MSKSTRRQFLQNSTLAAGSLALAANAHAAGNDVLKVALIGCGGRGTGAAAALKADANVKLVAMADAFEDKLEASLQRLQQNQAIAQKIDVPRERRFVGFDAYKNAIAASDVVLLCSPPGFRPLHMKAAVEANKHIFAEKPIAVDAPGVRSVLETCAEARRKNLSVVSGLCLRYSTTYKDMLKKVHDGQIGNISALQANDLRGRIWMFPRQPQWSDMEWQMRNWYYFAWLSGDFNVEQHVHMLDVCAWVMRDTYPVKCFGLGGRAVRTGTEFGHIYDHFSVTYEYENGVKLFSHCRQQTGCKNDIAVYAFGSQGNAEISERRMTMTGPNESRLRFPDTDDFYQYEHNELFQSIRNSRPINNGEYMCKSTQLAIMARMAAYTGQELTWDQAWNSREDLTPARYEWGQMPMPEVAKPGVTRFV